MSKKEELLKEQSILNTRLGVLDNGTSKSFDESTSGHIAFSNYPTSLS